VAALNEAFVGPAVAKVDFVTGNGVIPPGPSGPVELVGTDAVADIDPVLRIDPVGPGVVSVALERGYGVGDSVPLSTLSILLGTTVPVIGEKLPVMLALNVGTKIVLVNDSWLLGVTRPDEGRVEGLPIPVDGGIKLPVALVSGYGADELDPVVELDG
jgi:hypothetical protein